MPGSSGHSPTTLDLRPLVKLNPYLIYTNKRETYIIHINISLIIKSPAHWSVIITSLYIPYLIVASNNYYELYLSKQI